MPLPCFGGSWWAPERHFVMMTEIIPAALIVEDNELDKWLTIGFLKQHGWQVHDFSTAEAALKYIQDNPRAVFSIALVDIQLPGMSGIEFIRRLNHARPEIQVVVVTGHLPIKHGKPEILDVSSPNLQIIMAIEKPLTKVHLDALWKKLHLPLELLPAPAPGTTKHSVDPAYLAA